MVSPRSQSPIRYGLPSAAGIVGGEDLGDRRAGGGRGCCDAGLEHHARVHVVGRSGAQDQRRRLHGVTASNAHVARLAPPVRMRRSSTLTSPRTGSTVAAGSVWTFVVTCAPNPNSRCATRRIWISSEPSVIR